MSRSAADCSAFRWKSSEESPTLLEFGIKLSGASVNLWLPLRTAVGTLFLHCKTHDNHSSGISTCPNDTFAFHGLLTKSVDWRGLQFEVELLDIQQLNDGLFAGAFDVAKASFHAALYLTDSTVVLPSGSALGFGVGPLLLSAVPGTVPKDESQVTLCPGELTTAAMLFRLFYSNTTRIEHTVFSAIMPRLQQRTADFGVCIHEGRFTWQNEGLGLVEDLGTRWEKLTGCPLPLGGILASRRLPDEVISRVQAVSAGFASVCPANPRAPFPHAKVCSGVRRSRSDATR